MKVLALDMSSHTGWACIEDGKLIGYGLIENRENLPDFALFVSDYSLVARALDISVQIQVLVKTLSPDKIYIEQTNKGQNRTSQKFLEFIHFAVLTALSDIKFAHKLGYIDTSEWRSSLGVRMSKDDRINNKMVKQGKKRGKITPKHLSVRWVNLNYSLALKLKDNDIADAVCVAACGIQKENNINKPTTIDLDSCLC